MTILNRTSCSALIAALLPSMAHAGAIASTPMPPPKPTALLISSGIVASIAEELASETGAFPGDRSSPDESGALASFGNDGWRTRIEGDLARRDDGITLIPDGSGGSLLPGTNALGKASSAGLDEGQQALTGLANVWIDLVPSGPLTPYLGGGIGAAHVALENVRREGREPVDDTDFILAWQLGAGIGWDVLPNWSVTLDYRWFNAESSNSEPGHAEIAVGPEISAHEVYAVMHLMF